MDEIVKAALKKWPQVPDCRGWLALDARGEWYMRDDRVQAAGPFPRVKGSRILHEKLREFIHRNYACDAAGAWYFQNGPQRVYVELEAAPFVWRVAAAPQGVWLDDAGRLFIDTDIGFGLVHTQDMHEAARAVESGLWVPQALAYAAMPQRFGFVPSPQQAWTWAHAN